MTVNEQSAHTRQSLQALMGALKANEAEAIQSAKAMTVFCKTCQHQFSFAKASVNKQTECFQLLCPRCRELVLEIRTKNTQALRLLAKEFPQGDAVSFDLGEHDDEARYCEEAFKRHDYELCVSLAYPLVTQFFHPYLTQLLLISALRLNKKETVERVSATALGPTATYSPWEAILLKLTLGLIGADEAMKSARSESDKCRVYFYVAARQITLGQRRQAKELLQQCQRMDVTCAEHFLAETELELV